MKQKSSEPNQKPTSSLDVICEQVDPLPDPSIPNPSPTPIPELSNPEPEYSLLTSKQKELMRSLNSVDSFKSLLKKFYKEIGFDLSKFQAANPQIDYLFNLFSIVFKVGGWSIMNGTNAWSGLSKCFGYMQPAKLREDYENFLFALEKSHGLFAYDIKTIDSFLIDINPELMVIPEWHQTSLLVNEINRGGMLRILNMESIVVPQFLNGILGVALGAVVAKGREMKFLFNGNEIKLDEVCELSSFYVEGHLETTDIYEELSGKVPSLLHWNSSHNLLRYSAAIPGLTSPLLIVLKNSYTLIGGPSYLNLNGVYSFLEGKSECFGIHFQHMQLLQKKVHKDYGIDIFVNGWKPNEKYLLINGIEFIYVRTNPGDSIVTKTDIVYWVVSDYCQMIHWYLLPDFRLEESALSYKNSKTDSHKFSLPLICIEYLNLHMDEVSEDLMSTMKKVVSQSVDDEYWTGQFSIEIIDYRSCSLCGKDLIWRYARCPACTASSPVSALCLKCAQEHKCKSLELIEKFSITDLEKLYNRLEKRTKEPAQGALSKVSIRAAEAGAGDCIKYDPERVIASDDYRTLIWKTSEKVVSSKPKVIENVKRVEWNLDLVYKRMGQKKQKIREAMENPLSGPRFNYEFEGKKDRETQEIPALNIPILAKSRDNPLSRLVKDKKTNGLSSLIKVDRKKELEMRRKMK